MPPNKHLTVDPSTSEPVEVPRVLQARNAVDGASRVLALQRTAGNRAVAAFLKRGSLEHARARNSRNRRSIARQAQARVPGRPHEGEPYVSEHWPPAVSWRPSPVLPPGVGATLSGTQQYLASYAANVYGPGHQLHRELTYHYVYGNGRPFHLPHRRMYEVIAPGPRSDAELRRGKGINLFDFTGRNFSGIQTASAQLRARLDAAGEYTSASVELADRGFATCDDDKPSLGGFTCTVRGTLTAFGGGSSPAMAAWMGTTWLFEGTMRWYDRWDFDIHRPATRAEIVRAEREGRTLPAQTRPLRAEQGVRDAASHLPGTPFDVHSDEVPIRQTSGEWARW